MEWDDLRLFLAVARARSVTGAADTLGVNASTVSRRIRGFESRLHVRLFERLPTGWATTPAGEEMLDAAERIEEEVSRLDRRVAGRDRRLGGSLRVTMPDLFALWLTPALAEFSHAFPAIELEVITGNAFANLSRRDADIALRTTNDPPESLVGRRLATVAFALYGSEAYLARHRDVRELSQHRWLGWDRTLADIATSRWMRQHLGGARFSYRVNSPAAMLAAVKAGLGVTFLLCFAADAEPTLRRLEPPRPELTLGLWLLTHRDLRRTARVRSFVDFLANAIARERAALEGRRRGRSSDGASPSPPDVRPLILPARPAGLPSRPRLA